jgi:lysine/arginine/ornithine transport system substrate-binding protein
MTNCMPPTSKGKQMKHHTLMMTAPWQPGSFALPVMAESILRYGIEAQYPPFEYKSASGELQGMDVELGQAVCAEAHLKCSWVENAFDGLIPALQGKKFDAINSAMNATEQRRKSIAFTSIIYRVPSMVIARKGSGITSAADKLQGKSMGVLQGSIQETYARSHWESAGVRVVSYQDQNQVYADMATGRLDATLVMAPRDRRVSSPARMARTSSLSVPCMMTRFWAAALPLACARMMWNCAKTGRRHCPPASQRQGEGAGGQIPG